jgi:hypothetical protein
MSKESDFDTHKKDTDKSSVWYHYLTAKDGKSAKCKKMQNICIFENGGMRSRYLE